MIIQSLLLCCVLFIIPLHAKRRTIIWISGKENKYQHELLESYNAQSKYYYFASLANGMCRVFVFAMCHTLFDVTRCV